MKIRGAELQQWVDAWPDGPDWYLDSGVDDFNLDTIDPETTYNTDDMGYLGYQGADALSGFDAARSVEGSIRAWRKKRDFDTLVVTVPKADREKFTAMCKSNGWRVGR